VTSEFMSLHRIIEKDKLQEGQDKLAVALNLGIITLDEKGNFFTNPSNYSEFCKMVTSTSKGCEICRNSHIGNRKEFTGTPTPFIYNCCPGIINIASPLKLNDKILGYIVCGQAFLIKPDQFTADKMLDKYKDLDLDKKQLVKKFFDIQVITKGRMYAAGESILSFTRFLADSGLKNILQKRVNEELKSKAEMKNLIRLAEIKTLQAQINPHFLFNAMNAISTLAMLEGAEKTHKSIQIMSKILRYAMQGLEEFVPLEHELEHIRNYMYIQELRFGRKIKSFINIPDKLNSLLVPAMLLQPIVENSVRHGLEPKKGQGRITITASYENEDILICISDDGVGMEPEELNNLLNTGNNKEKIGVMNVHKRLRHYYGESYGLEVESVRGQGTKVFIRLPRNTVTGGGLYCLNLL
jgi:two-component system LytT family sensor kinase